MAGPKWDIYPDSRLGTQTDIRNRTGHTTKKNSIVRIVWLPIKVTHLSTFLVASDRELTISGTAFDLPRNLPT